ncbi:MAG TPA: hypothetical protein VK666_16210 [Chryseolinea sp.]|nr:hypothetical protein [Chryseolinea sp.]
MRNLVEGALLLNGRSHLMPKSNFLKYSVKNLLLDESFLDWVIEGHCIAEDARLNWWNEHSEKKTNVGEARAIVQQLRSALNDDVSREDLKEVWAKISNSVNVSDYGLRFKTGE